MNYWTGELVFPAQNPQYLVAFTERHTKEQWGQQENEGDKKNEANQLSLLVTPDHEMYVQMNDSSIPFGKISAAELAQHKAPGAVARVLSSAEQGFQPSDPLTVADAAADSPVVQLGLRSESELAAFLELYGFIVGSRHVSSAPSALTLATSASTEPNLFRLLSALNLASGTDWALFDGSLSIHNEAWVCFFAASAGEGFLPWVLSRLSKGQVGLVLRGLRQAQSVELQ